MSARVFKPILLSEMPKMRSSPDVKLASRGITKVRRALFNPDAEETRRFIDDELSKLATNHSERWGFDFISGRPLIDSPYAWIPVRNALLQQRPVKHVISPDISDLYPPILPELREEEKMSIDETLLSPSPSMDSSSTPRKQLQSKITDFLSVRKRTDDATSSTTKKIMDNTSRPRKIPRLTS